ncbi:MAG: GFA family protein [Reinekea sp.]|jgi:hypothetical protein
MKYHGSCHCQAVRFEFSVVEEITSGVRCNCSICRRKGTLMAGFTLAPDDITITADSDALSCYEFGSNVAHHWFCKRCGIHPFHQTMRKPGHYRVNLGCIEELDALQLPFEVLDGASI